MQRSPECPTPLHTHTHTATSAKCQVLGGGTGTQGFPPPRILKVADGAQTERKVHVCTCVYGHTIMHDCAPATQLGEGASSETHTLHGLCQICRCHTVGEMMANMPDDKAGI